MSALFWDVALRWFCSIVTDVLGQWIGPIYQRQGVQAENSL
jgi:hypothetical protein